jgi:hypothetical protein
MRIEIGDVIHFKNQQINKNKFHVCVCVARNYYLVINTEYRSFYDCIEIKSSDYAFLKDKNRFIECSQIFQQDIILADNVKKVGKINNDDLYVILSKIEKSARLYNYQKEPIILEIKKYLSRI